MPADRCDKRGHEFGWQCIGFRGGRHHAVVNHNLRGGGECFGHRGCPEQIESGTVSRDGLEMFVGLGNEMYGEAVARQPPGGFGSGGYDYGVV
ncbi:Uncharacterised protein [Mycobacteroides abscessus subsp. abscessus]|nr:Uncharacterised protein [Mycobacteroides abscessus subsp. abscessus]